MKKQSKKAKMDESLGERRGKEASKMQSYKSRRDESKESKKHADKKMDIALIKKMMKKGK